MASLNLSCNNSDTRDTTGIQIKNDKISSVTNGVEGCSIPLKDLFWSANTVSCYKISLLKNGYAEFVFQNTGGLANTTGKFIAILNENSIYNEKQYENSNIFFSFGTSNVQPLGKLTVMSGTSSNPMDGIFKFYNGTYTGNISNISGGTNDTTISIIAGYN